MGLGVGAVGLAVGFVVGGLVGLDEGCGVGTRVGLAVGSGDGFIILCITGVDTAVISKRSKRATDARTEAIMPADTRPPSSPVKTRTTCRRRMRDGAGVGYSVRTDETKL